MPRPKTKPKFKRHTFLGIDGEGVGRRPHVYTYLGGADREGNVHLSLEHPTTVEALSALLKIPPRFTLVSYSFAYDWTKILAELPNESLYKLFRPELRQRWHYGARRLITDPVIFKGYALDWCAGRMNIKGLKSKKKVVIWDIFKFFACSFVKTLETWKTCPPEVVARIKAMKDQRSEFDKLTDQQVNAYCLDECRFLAETAHALYDAHCEANLKLKGFYGAGSTSAALLTKLDVKEHRNDGPEEMREALASAFFGGRFEISRKGTVRGKVYNYDISSAYPYQCTRLPCLVCGNWKHTKSERVALRSRAAVIHTEVDISPQEPWTPLPFRTSKGEIAFPYSCFTYVWKAEFEAARRAFPKGVNFLDAWYLSGKCTCGRPYPMADISKVYRERIKLGKEGKGLVLKLGSNGAYGKLAQSIGTPQFQSWAWAGMITAGCRAQMLDMFSLVQDRRSILQIATDGIQTTERIDPPKPWDTGTYDLAKPLGGWEEKVYQGMVLLRPGVYFPPDPTPEQLDDIRARGLGKRIMQEQCAKAQKALESGEEGIQFPSVQRFVGCVSAVYLTPSGEYLRSEDYGEWVNREIKLSFSPLPKREPGKGNYLKTRSFRGQETAPYDAALISPEAEQLRRETIEMLEQPDGDYLPAEG
jgi:hypothetical protein